MVTYSYPINYWFHVGGGFGMQSGILNKEANVTSSHPLVDTIFNNIIQTHHKLKSPIAKIGFLLRLGEHISIGGHYSNLISKGTYARITISDTSENLISDQTRMTPVDDDFTSNHEGGIGIGIQWSHRWHSLFSYEFYDNTFWDGPSNWNNQIIRTGHEIYLSENKKLLLGGHYGFKDSFNAIEDGFQHTLLNDWSITMGYSGWSVPFLWTISGRYRQLNFTDEKTRIIELMAGIGTEQIKSFFRVRPTPRATPPIF